MRVLETISLSGLAEFTLQFLRHSCSTCICSQSRLPQLMYADDTQIYYCLTITAPLTPCANALMKSTVGCAKSFFT